MWYEGKTAELLANLATIDFSVKFLSDGENFFVWVNTDSTVDFIQSSGSQRGKYITIPSDDGNTTLAFVTLSKVQLLGHISPCISPSSVNPFANYDPEIAQTDFKMLCKDGTLRTVIKLDGVLYLKSENAELEPFKTSNKIVRMADTFTKINSTVPIFHSFLI